MTSWDTSDSHKSWGSNLVFWSYDLTFCVWTGYPPSKNPPQEKRRKNAPFFGPTTLTFPLFEAPGDWSPIHFNSTLPPLRPEINSEDFATQLLGRFRNAFTGRVHFDQTVRINGCQKPELISGGVRVIHLGEVANSTSWDFLWNKGDSPQ